MQVTVKKLLGCLDDTTWRRWVRRNYRGKQRVSLQAVLFAMHGAPVAGLRRQLFNNLAAVEQKKPTTVRQDTYVAGDLFLVGSYSFLGQLSVAGELCCSGDLTVNQILRINGGNVAGNLQARALYAHRSVTVDGDLCVESMADGCRVGTSLTVSGEITSVGDVIVGRSIYTRKVEVHGLLQAGGDLLCDGAVRAKRIKVGEIVIASSLYARVDVCCGAYLHVEKAISAGTEISAGGDIQAGSIIAGRGVTAGWDIVCQRTVSAGDGWAVTVGANGGRTTSTCTSSCKPKHLRGGKWKKVSTNGRGER